MTVTIYSKNPCPTCEQAKNVLKSRGIEFEVKVLGQDYDMEALMDKLEEVGLLGFRTFPLMIQNGKGFTFNTINEIV
ncbi:thioredoxin domain [Pseudomonas phage UNO-G1W1]|uniref:Thioredoxin domain n=1 Tax=Pseudomonas phage UNO-G1W1 TaxID=3136609 RepID=A0AAX4MW20_9CAUD